MGPVILPVRILPWMAAPWPMDFRWIFPLNKSNFLCSYCRKSLWETDVSVSQRLLHSKTICLFYRNSLRITSFGALISLAIVCSVSSDSNLIYLLIIDRIQFGTYSWCALWIALRRILCCSHDNDRLSYMGNDLFRDTLPERQTQILPVTEALCFCSLYEILSLHPTLLDFPQ